MRNAPTTLVTPPGGGIHGNKAPPSPSRVNTCTRASGMGSPAGLTTMPSIDQHRGLVRSAGQLAALEQARVAGDASALIMRIFADEADVDACDRLALLIDDNAGDTSRRYQVDVERTVLAERELQSHSVGVGE